MRKNIQKSSAKGLKKKPNRLFGFFYNNWITITLLVILSALIRQNFIINDFPNIIDNKKQTIQKNIAINNKLTDKNNSLDVELKAKSETNMEILESIARNRFGLIKNGETYYQIVKSTQE